MKTALISLIGPAMMVMASLTFTSCKTAQTDDSAITYEVAQNYFIRNDADNELPTVIASQSQLDSIFGMATTMGPDGKPTPIDFSGQYAVCVALPVTDMETQLAVDTVKEENDKLVVDYTVSRGERQSYSTRPFMLLIFDNKYGKDVELNNLSASRIEGKWRIENIVVSDEEYVRPSEETPDAPSFITFTGDGEYFIQTNCNSIGGSYAAAGDSIHIGDGFRTEMACDNMKAEDMIVKVLPLIDNFDIQSDTTARLNSATSAYIVLSRSEE